MPFFAGISPSPSPRAGKDGSKSNKGGGRGARVAVAPGGAASYQAEEQRLLSRKGILKRIAGTKTVVVALLIVGKCHRFYQDRLGTSIGKDTLWW
jgi:hypothetical protein